MSHTPVPEVVSHQTVRLARGAHGSPADGVCVMELASMLAGEPFGDHPRSVSRVVGSFLRAYNDAVDDARRQDLYRCAAEVVGTRGSRATERARLARCERELDDLRPRARPKTSRWVSRAVHALAPSSNLAGSFLNLARGLCTTDGGHRRALTLIDDLVAIEVPPAPPCRPMTGKAGTAVRTRRRVGS